NAATVPINRLEGMVTNPSGGVMATSPTTAPMQKSRAEGFFALTESNSTQHNAAAAEAVLVAATPEAASAPALSALPALKPNQPNQSKPVPNSTKGMLAGLIGSFSSDLVLRYMEATRAAKPADM